MRFLSALAFVAALAACHGAPEPLPRAERIVLVSFDTLRADALAGPALALLPNVAQLVAEGAHFTHAWAAASYTLPAHAAMLTGRDAAEHPLEGPHPQLAAGFPTLAQRLRREGFATRAFHEGGYVRGSYGFARGFEKYTQLPRRALPGPRFDEVLAWIDAQGERPFFLFLHTYAAHDPYGGWRRLRAARPELALPSAVAVRELAARYPVGVPIPPAHRQLFRLFNPLADRELDRVRAVELRPVDALAEDPRFEPAVATMRESYSARVAGLDAMLGRLRAHLEAHDLWRDTLLVVTSDHGEAFFEHGQPWHGYVPYDEVLRVPWIVSFPRLFEAHAPVGIDATVWHLDLVPTLLALAGAPPAPELSGRDLSAALAGRAEPAAEHPVFPLVREVEYLGPEPQRRVAIRAPWKLVPYHPRFHAAGDQLFDISADPGETHNLLPARSDEARALKALADAYEASLRPAPPARSGAQGPEESEALRELGYLK